VRLAFISKYYFMIKLIKNFLKRKAFNYSKNFINVIEDATLAYSQEGEDLLLSKFFGPRNKGFFIDVGAHRPKLYSNTYFFYKKGWNGINIDPLPGTMEGFKKVRPRDINLEVAISNKAEELTYYMFHEPALNTFSKEDADFRIKLEGCTLLSTRIIKTIRLDEILDKYLPTGTEIDFLTIDVEGLDMQVLLSNNWEKYRPKIVLLEYLRSSMENLLKSDLCKFMSEKKYKLHGRTVSTVVFIANDCYEELTGVNISE
jgi:FkbM family methyltransferase